MTKYRKKNPIAKKFHQQKTTIPKSHSRLANLILICDWCFFKTDNHASKVDCISTIDTKGCYSTRKSDAKYDIELIYL